MNGKIKNIKKTIIIALIIALVPAQAQAWTFSGAYEASKSYISNNVKAVAAAVAGVVAIATSAILWKRISDRNARIAAEAKLQAERAQQRAEREAKAQAELAAREFENIEPLHIQEGQQIVPEAQVLRAVPSTSPIDLHRSVTPEAERQLAQINDGTIHLLVSDYEQLRRTAIQKIDNLEREKSDIEARLNRLSARMTLDEVKQLEAQSKSIKQKAAIINDILSENFIQMLDASYTQNFSAHDMHVDPTQAYQILGIQPIASQAPSASYIKQKRDEAFAQAQGDERKLWQVRQAGWIFGYPNCTDLARQVYDLYLAWARAGKPALFNEKANEFFDQRYANRALLLSTGMQLDLKLADMQDGILMRQRQDEKDAQEYEHVGFNSLDELREAYAELNRRSTIELNKIAQSNAYNRADLILFREYKHELEMMQQGTVLLRENPSCQDEAQRIQLNTLFFEITRKIAGLEKLITQWSGKLEEPLRKAKSDIALEKAQGVLASVADYYSQAGELASAAQQAIKNKARSLMP